MKKQVIYDIVSILYVTLFFYAALSKLIDFKQYQNSMHAQPLPNWLATSLIFSLPGLELLIATFFFIPGFKIISLYCATGLMLIFTSYIILIEVNYFGKIPCACGGVIQSLTWTQHLYFNLILIVLSILAIITSKVNLATRTFIKQII